MREKVNSRTNSSCCGFGRIGRMLLRIALRRNVFTPVSTAALLEVDTNYGRWQKR
jgi:glyceraldehyde 3-phosphate dehydrogenase